MACAIGERQISALSLSREILASRRLSTAWIARAQFRRTRAREIQVESIGPSDHDSTSEGRRARFRARWDGFNGNNRIFERERGQ